MRSAGRRIRQLFSHQPGDLLWLAYIVAVAPWLHRVARPWHLLCRRQVRRSRRTNLEHRLDILRARVAGRTEQGSGHRLELSALSPELDRICRLLRRPNQDIPLADIDQDGFFRPCFPHFWPAPCVDSAGFAPRLRFELTVVDRDGYVGVRKGFRGDTAAFVNELETLLDLNVAGCRVPAILAVDFVRQEITLAYIHGAVVRETLAAAGARLRDRDRIPSRFPFGQRALRKQYMAAARRLVDTVLDRNTIARLGETLLAIHRAGYVVEDLKYGNVIIEADSGLPYFVDWERALPLAGFSRAAGTQMRDRDVEKLNRLFGTKLWTARSLRAIKAPAGRQMYAPVYAGAGIRWGAVWNPDLGIWRWRYMLTGSLPIPIGGRVLDLGANNGFNGFQMLRAGAAEVVAVEMDPIAIEQGLFLKSVYEWADNREYRISYVRGSHADLASMNLGSFELVTAFCTLYYLSSAAMESTVRAISVLTDTLVLQCNQDRSLGRSDPDTFLKASLPFNIELARNNGFPAVTTIERPGSARPLVISRKR